MKKTQEVDIYQVNLRHKRTRQHVEEDADILPENRKHILDFDDDMRRRQLSVHSRDKVVLILQRCGRLVKKDFKLMKRPDVEKLVDAILDAEDIGPSWKTEMQKYFKVFSKWLHKTDDYPDSVKWLKPKKPKTPMINPEHYVTVEEIKKMADTEAHPRNRAMIKTLWETGLRVGTLLTLRMGDVERDPEGDGCFLNMGEDVESKTGKWKVPVFYFWTDLADWLQQHPRKEDPTAFIFSDLNGHPGEPISYAAACKVWRAALRRCEIKRVKVNIHSIRHSSISWFAQSGLLTTQEICAKYWGTAHSGMINRYVHVNAKQTMAKLKGKTPAIDNPRPKTCVRCGIVNDAFETECRGCHKSLTPAAETDHQRKLLGMAIQLDRLIKEGNPELYAELHKMNPGGVNNPA